MSLVTMMVAVGYTTPGAQARTIYDSNGRPFAYEVGNSRNAVAMSNRRLRHHHHKRYHRFYGRNGYMQRTIHQAAR